MTIQASFLGLSESKVNLLCAETFHSFIHMVLNLTFYYWYIHLPLLGFKLLWNLRIYTLHFPSFLLFFFSFSAPIPPRSRSSLFSPSPPSFSFCLLSLFQGLTQGLGQNTYWINKFYWILSEWNFVASFLAVIEYLMQYFKNRHHFNPENSLVKMIAVIIILILSMRT